MQYLPKSLQRLISELNKLPSVGGKSAARLAYHLINHPQNADALAAAMRDAAGSLQQCKQCYFITDDQLCLICKSTNRDHSLVCIVEKPADLIAIEQAGVFRGFYHVLHQLWSPIRGQGLDSMHLAELIERSKKEEVTEVIIATGATVEGEATALYLARLLNDSGIRATRLAQGLPKGGDLEYLDDVTLSRALSGRTII